MVEADEKGKPKWSDEKRERVLRQMANFTLVNKGLDSIEPKGNPFTLDELNELKEYTAMAQSGKRFEPYEAQEYRDLTERASREYPGQDWVVELLKIGLIIFAIYAIGKALGK